jgi:molecular chaperone GrpE (heat shock protein)
MAAAEHDTEQGFGTGLRAQLEKRRETEEAIDEPAAPEAPELPPAAEAVELPDFAQAELAALRRDLAEAHAREQDVRAELADLQNRLEQDIPAAQAMSLRSAEVDQRAAKLVA